MRWVVYIHTKHGQQITGQYELYCIDQDEYDALRSCRIYNEQARELRSSMGAWGYTAILPVKDGEPIPWEIYPPEN